MGKKKLANQIFMGLVENVHDKTKKGRIQVRIQSIFNDIPTEDLPWAEPQRSLDGKSFCIPAIGKMVNVIFVGGNIYDPQYIYSQNYNTNLQQKLKDLDDEDYERFVSLIFDDRTQIYSDKKKLILDYKFNQLSLKNDGIDIHLKDNDQELHLGHNLASQSAMLGDHFLEWFDGFMKTLLQPTSLTGLALQPIVKPLIDQEILKYQALRDTFLSQHVKVVDNASCIDFGEDRKNTPIQDDATKINEKQILESDEVPDEVKENIIGNRKKDAIEQEESAPNPKDNAINEEDDVDDEVVDSPYPYIPPAPSKDTPLTDEEKSDISRTKNIQQNKLSILEKNESSGGRKYDNYDDYYGDRDAGIGRNAKNDAIYGSYVSLNVPEIVSKFGTGSGSGGSESGGNGLYRQTKYGKIFNGNIPLENLTKITEWKYSDGGDIVCYLEENAAKAWIGLVAELKKAFPNNKKKHTLWCVGNPYRTYSKQKNLYARFGQGAAAKPGHSMHGWGLAIDVNNWDGLPMTYDNELYMFLTEHAPKWKICNPYWARPKATHPEPWHWEYHGDSIYGAGDYDTFKKYK